jgi:TatD DNase family protein
MYIDSHAHLFFKDFKDDLEVVLGRAKTTGIDYIVNPGTDLETSKESVDLARSHKEIYAAVGFHPHDASKANTETLAEIERLSYERKVVAIGEIGLDYHYNFSPPEQQREVFATQIEIAVRRNLPIIIHSREAEPDTVSIVERALINNPDWMNNDGTMSPRGVFHCFPGDEAMARKVIGWGFFISIPGPVTFSSKPNKPNTMAEVVGAIPLEHILLETDSPYLTPVPHRGKRNEPSNIPLIAKKIAEIKGVPEEEVGTITSQNVRRLFGIPNQ